MGELDIHAPHFALDLVFIPFNQAIYCVTNKQKSIIYLCLPMMIVNCGVTIDVDAYGDDHLLYHELIHGKDCLEEDFRHAG